MEMYACMLVNYFESFRMLSTTHSRLRVTSAYKNKSVYFPMGLILFWFIQYVKKKSQSAVWENIITIILIFGKNRIGRAPYLTLQPKNHC